MLGDGVFTVTLAIEALRVDHNASGLAYVLAARIVPTVMFVLFSGAVVDRVPRRLAMLASDAVRGAAVAAIAVLVASGTGSLGALVVMAVVFGVADAFYLPASTAITPELVPGELLTRASALNATSTHLALILVGPALGGVAVAALGTAWGFGIDAVSFALSAACLIAMSARPRPTPTKRSARSDIIAGLRYVGSQRWLWVTITGAGLANFVAMSPLAALVPLLVERSLHHGSLALWLVLATGGAGGLTASLVLGRLGAPRWRITFLWLGWGLAGLCVLGLGLSPDVWAAGAMAFVAYGLAACGSIVFNPLVQEQVPSHMLGRVASVNYLVSLALSPLGLVVAGIVAGAFGVRTTLMIGGAISALTIFIPLVPGVRDPDCQLTPTAR